MRHAFTPIALLCLIASLVPVHPLWAATYAYIPSNGNNLIVRVNTDTGEFSSVDFMADAGAVSCGPYGVAVMPDGSYVLVTCNDDDSLAALDGSSFSGSIRSPNAAGTEPRGVAIEPSGRYAYVANYADDTVSVISISSRTPRETVDVGQGPCGIAAVRLPGVSDADTTKIYVANYGAGTVSVLTDNGSAVTTQTISGVGTNPVGVAASPDGQYVYVAIYNAGTSGSLTVIRTSTNEVVQRITVGAGAWGVAVGAMGDYVYVTNSAADTVSVVQTSSNTVVGNAAVGLQPFGIGAAKNGDFAYAITDDTDAPITKLVVNTWTSSVTATDITNDNVHTISAPYALGAFIGGTPPAAPSNLSATEESYDTINLTWTDNSSDELGFKIERRIKDETAYVEIARVDAGAVSYTDDRGLASETTYEYRIRAYNAAADSDYIAVAGDDAPTTEEGNFSWCFIGTIVK